MALCLFLCLSLLGSHPTSLSSSRVLVVGNEAQVTLHCQGLSMLEVFPELDSEGRGEVDAKLARERQNQLFEYILGHYRLYEIRPGNAEPRLLATDQLSLRFTPPASESLFRADGGTFEFEFRARAEEPLVSLELRLDLFRESAPAHVDLTQIEWPGNPPQSFVLGAERPWVRSLPSEGGGLGAFVALGLEHILFGFDHLAFLLALLFASRRLGGVLLWVTAFTLAHSVTLALAGLGVVDTSAWKGLIESTIALSIAYVAADNLWRPDQQRSRWPEAFLFGLLHGLGFASFLSASLVQSSSRPLALLGFNLGIELGQLLMVALVLVPFLVWNRWRAEPPEFLLPSWLRRSGSAAVALLGLWWFFQRI